MKNKIISFCMAVIILSSFFGGVNVYATLRGTSCEDEAALLVKMKVYPSGATTSFNTSNPVTRQDFAEYVAKAMGETDESVSGYTYQFTDLEAVGYIAKGAADGYISGYSDGSFKPAEKVTAGEAEKMIIEAVGYSYLAKMKGTSSDAYAATASEIGLAKNISKGANAEINISDATYLLYNMLNLPMPLMRVDGTEMAVSKDKTVLTEKFNIYKSSGIITANEYTAITRTEGVVRGYVEIKNTLYAKGESDAEKYLGYNVEYYYQENQGEYTLIYVDPAKKSKDLRMLASEIDRKDGDKYYYYDTVNAAKTTVANLVKTPDVIYNGRALLQIDDAAIYKPEFGSVTLIDNDNDGSYDLISIIDRKILVLNMYDEYEHIFYDKYSTDSQFTVDVEDSSNILTIKSSQGADVPLNQLKEWDVLEIAQSTDGVLTDIVVHQESLSGVIRAVSSDYDGTQLLTIDTKEYKVSDKLFNYNKDKGTPFEKGQTYNFVLNSDGIIVGYNSNVEAATDGKYGYLISVKKDETEDNFLWLKIFTADNVMKMFKTTEKIKIDGISDKAYEEFTTIDSLLHKTVQDEISHQTSVVANPILIYFKTDEQGSIKDIDTTEKTSKESVNTLLEKGDIVEVQKYSASHRTLSGVINFNDNSLVFLVPNSVENASEKDFEVKRAIDYFAHYATYSATGYSRDRIGPYSDVAVVKATIEASIQGGADVYLVQKIASGLNADDEETSVLELINGSGTVTYMTEDSKTIDSAKGLDGTDDVKVKAGDMIRFALNKSGEITLIQEIYSPSSDKFYSSKNPTSDNDYLNVMRMYMANVFYKGNNYLRIVNESYDLTDKSNISKIENGDIPLENLELASIFVYQEDGKVPYRVGTVNEIRDYYSSGVASRILIRTDDANTKIIVIYK